MVAQQRRMQAEEQDYQCRKSDNRGTDDEFAFHTIHWTMHLTTTHAQKMPNARSLARRPWTPNCQLNVTAAIGSFFSPALDKPNCLSDR
jgi:hypothetical protein